MGFNDGFRMGAYIARGAQRDKREEEEFRLRKEAHEKQIQLTNQQIAAGERTARVNQELDTETAGIRSFINGGFEQGNNGPADESAAMYGVNAGSRVNQPMDSSNPDHQSGLNRRMMSVAALKGDYTQVGALQEKQRELAEQRVFNQAVQQFSMDPTSFTDYERWVNKNNPMISVAPAKDPRTGMLTGYNLMTVGPSGDATYKFVSPQQAATLAGATALMQVNPTKALQLIGTVDQSMAAAIQMMNTATKDTVTTGNTATHNANQDVSQRMNAQANQAQVGVARERLGIEREKAKREKQTPAQQAQEKIDMYTSILMKENPKLSQAEAEKRAAGIIMRDPNAKDQDAGLAEAGIVKIKNKYYTLGEGNPPKLVPLKIEGQDATTEALKALLESGQDPFAPKPKKGREVSGKVN